MDKKKKVKKGKIDKIKNMDKNCKIGPKQTKN